jgi:hypothetical protein
MYTTNGKEPNKMIATAYTSHIEMILKSLNAAAASTQDESFGWDVTLLKNLRKQLNVISKDLSTDIKRLQHSFQSTGTGEFAEYCSFTNCGHTSDVHIQEEA